MWDASKNDTERRSQEMELAGLNIDKAICETVLLFVCEGGSKGTEKKRIRKSI